MNALDIFTVDTDAGTYSVEVHYDEEASYEEGGYRYGYVALAPNGDVVDSLWGMDDPGDYLTDQARKAAHYDARERLDQANTVGAGFVGII